MKPIRTLLMFVVAGATGSAAAQSITHHSSWVYHDHQYSNVFGLERESYLDQSGDWNNVDGHYGFSASPQLGVAGTPTSFRAWTYAKSWYYTDIGQVHFYDSYTLLSGTLTLKTGEYLVGARLQETGTVGASCTKWIKMWDSASQPVLEYVVPPGVNQDLNVVLPLMGGTYTYEMRAVMPPYSPEGVEEVEFNLAAVPEPATLLTLGLGMAAIGRRRRPRRCAEGRLRPRSTSSARP